MRGIRLAIVVSHPIQHFVHFYRELAKQPELTVKVFFCSRIGLEEYFDSDMGTVIRWADDMTRGFDHEFLPEAGNITDTRFRSVDNPSVADALKVFSPDVVVVYGYSQITPLRALAWCRMRNVPILMASDANAVTKRSALKRLLRQIVLRPLLAQFSAFLTAGDQNEDLLHSLGITPRYMHRCPFTIDESGYRAIARDREQSRMIIRKKYGIPESAFVGIAVGKFVPLKRTKDAVIAFSEAGERLAGQRKVHLLLCGSGPELSSVASEIDRCKSPATLAGFVNIDQLPKYYCAADVLVHMSDRDNHPLVCSEAACIGLPMILSDLVGTIGKTDISREGENALVYPCGDVGALADAIVRLATDRQLLANMSDASLRIFEECSLSASVDGLLRAVRSVASQELR